MKKLILLSLAVSSFIFAQTPKVYWVDVHNGNDGNNGLASSTAFKTIQYVFSNANSLLSSSTTDTIKVLPSITSSNPNGYYDFGDNTIGLSSSRNFGAIVSKSHPANSLISSRFLKLAPMTSVLNPLALK